MTTIKERIQELKEFQQIVWDKYSGNCSNVPLELYTKYRLASNLMGDLYYLGDALDITINELEKIAEVENK